MTEDHAHDHDHRPGAPAAAGLADLRAPADVIQAITRFRDALNDAAGRNLAGLVLYGGLAHGRFRPGASDVNVAVVLHETTPPALAAVARALRAAGHAVAINPMILSWTEVPRVADVFPTKILDLQARHLLLAGADPFHGLMVKPEHVRLRIEQELRNLELRLRRRYLGAVDQPAALHAALLRARTPLAAALAAFLRYSGKGLSPDAAPGDVFAAAAAAWDLDAAALGRLAGLPDAPDPSGERLDPAALFGAVMAAVARAADAADAAPAAPRREGHA